MTVACIDKAGKFVEPTPATLARATPTQLAAIDGVRAAMKAMRVADIALKEALAAVHARAAEYTAALQWEHKHPSGPTRIQAAKEWIESTR